MIAALRLLLCCDPANAALLAAPAGAVLLLLLRQKAKWRGVPAAAAVLEVAPRMLVLCIRNIAL